LLPGYKVKYYTVVLGAIKYFGAFQIKVWPYNAQKNLVFVCIYFKPSPKKLDTGKASLPRKLYFTQFALFLSFLGSEKSIWMATDLTNSRNDKSSIYDGA
jgi:hypothetical protein